MLPKRASNCSGLLAIGFAVAALVTLVWTIGSNAARALYEYDAGLSVTFADDAFNPDTMIKDYERPLIEQGILSEDTIIRREFRGQIGRAIDAAFMGSFENKDESHESDVRDLVSGGNVDSLFAEVVDANAIGAALRDANREKSVAELYRDNLQVGPGEALEDVNILLSGRRPALSEGRIRLSEFRADERHPLSNWHDRRDRATRRRE